MTHPINGPQAHPPKNIADQYHDLLSELDDGPRMGLVQRLAVGYYEGWRPTRTQVANLISREAGRMTEDEYLSLLRSGTAREPRQRLPVQGLRVVQQADRPTPTDRQKDGDIGRAGRAEPNSSRMQNFTVVCGQLLASADFVARGLSSGGWVHRGNAMYRLVSLHYEIVPQMASSDGAHEPRVFSAPITCLPDIEAPHESTDGTSALHTVRPGRVMGVRGPWPVSPVARQLQFLIYPQPSPSNAARQHPAGALWVDLRKGHAHWRHIADRSASTTGRPIEKISMR